jgi:hypothetical protein
MIPNQKFAQFMITITRRRLQNWVNHLLEEKPFLLNPLCQSSAQELLKKFCTFGQTFGAKAILTPMFNLLRMLL